MNSIIHTIDGHPDVGSPKISVFATITIININASTQSTIPMIAEISNGTVEKQQSLRLHTQTISKEGILLTSIRLNNTDGFFQWQIQRKYF